MDGFGDWKDAVGLPPEFPRLHEITEPFLPGDATTTRPLLNPRIYLGKKRSVAINTIVQSLGMPLVAVCVEEGHGATTLARLIYARTEQEAITTRAIPVRLALEDHIMRPDDPLTPASTVGQTRVRAREIRRARRQIAEHAFAAFEQLDLIEWIYDAIRRGILGSLANHPWERILGRAEYGSLIGARTQDDDALATQRAHLAAVVMRENIDDGHLNERAPQLAGDVQGLVRLLNERRQIRISLQVDLSPSRWGRMHTKDGEQLHEPYLQVVRQFAQALKNLDDQNSRTTPPTLPSLIDQAVFISPAALNVFTNEWNRQPEQIAFPWYRPVDVFAILAHHYPPQHASPGVRPTDRLSALLRSERLVGVDRTMAITTAIERMEEQLAASMRNPDLITYHADEAQALPAPTTRRLNHVEARLHEVEQRLGISPQLPDESWE